MHYWCEGHYYPTNINLVFGLQYVNDYGDLMREISLVFVRQIDM